MAAAYMHIGIPVTNKKPGMVYNEGARFWVSSVDDYDYKIEYLKFEEGTPFPEVLHRNPHVAYKVDDLQKYIDDADSVICGPMDAISVVGITIFPILAYQRKTDLLVVGGVCTGIICMSVLSAKR